MIHQHRYVFAGVDAFTRLLGLRRCVLAVRRSARPHLAPAVADIRWIGWKCRTVIPAARES
jgi:hypothetical protein